MMGKTQKSGRWQWMVGRRLSNCKLHIAKCKPFEDVRHSSVLLSIIFSGCIFFFPLPPAGAKQICKDSVVATAPDTSFTIHNDGTVTDNTTGLMWMRCSLGQTWDGKTCSGTVASYSWAAGLKAAAGVEFAGHDDWRLPNKNELESIVEGRCISPAIDTRVFPATPSAYFWSSSPYAAISHGAWSVDFGYGTVNASVKSGSIHIRLVRDAE